MIYYLYLHCDQLQVPHKIINKQIINPTGRVVNKTVMNNTKLKIDYTANIVKKIENNQIKFVFISLLVITIIYIVKKIITFNDYRNILRIEVERTLDNRENKIKDNLHNMMQILLYNRKKIDDILNLDIFMQKLHELNILKSETKNIILEIFICLLSLYYSRLEISTNKDDQKILLDLKNDIDKQGLKDIYKRILTSIGMQNSTESIDIMEILTMLTKYINDNEKSDNSIDYEVIKKLIKLIKSTI